MKVSKRKKLFKKNENFVKSGRMMESYCRDDEEDESVVCVAFDHA